MTAAIANNESMQGVLLVWLEPEDGLLSAFHDWHRNGGFLEMIPGVTGYSVLSAQDDEEATKPFRFQIAYFVKNLTAITSSTYDTAIAGKPECVRATEWHLYKSLLSEGVSPMPDGSVCVQIGQTPFDDADALQEFDQWFRNEHMPMLTKVPGWRAGRRMEFARHIGGERREYAAPFVNNHRYLAENGLDGPEWQASVETEWTLRIRKLSAKANHRRVWTIEKEVALG